MSKRIGCTFLLTAALLLFAGAFRAEAAAKHFVDVADGAYYHNAVYWASEKGVTSGTGDNTFSPDAPCTRGQVVTLIWHTLGDPEAASSDINFTDVKAGSYYEKAVYWAYGEGITSGKSATRFDPDGTCTRGEFVTFLYNTCKKPAVSGSHSFSDVVPGRYYEKPVIWAVTNGITNGTGADTFSPDMTVTRGQVATFLYVWYTRTTMAASVTDQLVNVRDFGAVPNDNTDDKAAMNAAIENALNTGKDTVYIPAGTYDVSIDNGIGINLYDKNNIHLILDAGTVINTLPTDAGTFGTIYIRNASGVTVHGGEIIGGRNNHVGDYGEWGNGIMFLDSSNVTVSGVRIRDTWGDGLYFGTRKADEAVHGNSNISVASCTVDNARRSSVSIVDADYLSINGCSLTNANGISPQAGINIEPNPNSAGQITDDLICRHINITSTHVAAPSKDDSAGQFFCFRTQYYPGSSIVTADDVTISGCTFDGNAGNYSGTNARIINSNITGTYYDRMNTSLEGTSCGSLYRF